MKKATFLLMLVFTAVTFSSCGSKKSPIKTYVTPCSDCVKVKDALRVWASGTSDSETTARKKALYSASAELASVLSKKVETVAEEYTASLNNGEQGESKSFLSEKSIITVKSTVEGATIVCDEWHKDKETGMYTNYIVLELKGTDFLKALMDEIKKDNSADVDNKLLEELFMKNINK